MTKYIIPVLMGLFIGQVFAEEEQQLVTLVNTLHIGYDDNVYKTANAEESAYISDTIDLSVDAALADSTDLMFKSRLDYRADKETKFYPSLYSVLTHSASPRLFLKLSDTFQSGNLTTRDPNTAAIGRVDYWRNTLSFVPSYVLNPKSSLSAPLSYTAQRHDTQKEDIDYDLFSAGLTWMRELNSDLTYGGLSVNQSRVDYNNQDVQMDSTRLTTLLSHTFNPELQGNVEVGASFNNLDLGPKSSDSVNPYISAELSYDPSPSTRLTASLSRKFTETQTAQYAGTTRTMLSVGAEHDFTAKITGKVNAGLSENKYDASDSQIGLGDNTDNGVTLGTSVQYELNRVNFIELGLKYNDRTYDASANDWDSTMVDLGWRVEL